MSDLSSRTRILLVDDDAALAQTVRAVLRVDRCTVDVARTVTEALRRIRTHAYDAVVLDVGLPDGTGLDVIRPLREGGRTVPVLVLASRDRGPDVMRGLAAAADDALAKPFAPDDLRARIRALLQRGEDAEPAELSLGELVLDTRARRATLRGQPLALQPHELRILEGLLLQPGRVLSRSELLGRAWDPRLPPEPVSLDAMIAGLRRLLRPAGIDIAAVRGAGYQLTARTPGFQEDEGFRTLFYDAAAGIALMDADGRIAQFNPALVEMLGHTPESLSGLRLFELLHEADVAAAPRIRELLRGEGGYHQAELRFRRKDGSTLWGLVSLSPVRGSGTPRFALGMVLDITERKRAEEALQRLSLTDELTGVYNRRGLVVLADQQWRRAQRRGDQLVLVYVDLDGFKPINDTFGHDEGDRLLAATAAILKGVCRDSDIVARMGGDEFVVLATDAGTGGAGALQERIHHRIASFNADRTPTQPRLAASLGVVAFEPTETASLEELLGVADQRMYREKRDKGAGRS